MCGIAGVFGVQGTRDEIRSALEAMNAAQRHRGPDEQGLVVEPELGAGLASCRLSIVDIENGQQPVSNEDGSIHVVLNGEIYNHHALRQQLQSKGHRFRSRCDTEVIVHLYEEKGEEFLSHLHGMFGLAVLDTRNRRFLLARDSPGMKPLYYAQTPNGLLFASEAKALFSTGWVAPEPNPIALDTYLSMGFVPSPATAFRGMERLQPGEYLVVDGGSVRKRFYWRFRYPDAAPEKSDREYEEEFESILDRAVRQHLAADVKVGMFLSGGWDSSLTTTFAAKHAGSRLKTFSIIFPESPRMDESRHSRLMARELGTDHHEIEYRDALFLEALPRISRHLEEPIAAAPAGVAFLLASLTAKHVKTVISGEGADELFGGYEWMRIDWPYRLRPILPKRLVRQTAALCNNPRWRRALLILGAPSERAADVEWRRVFTPSEKHEILKPEFRASNRMDIEPAMLAPDIMASCADRVQRRLALDYTRRLPDCILFQEDKTSMAHSLEVRMPFLDRAIVDFALRLPSRLKTKYGREKVILSRLASRHLPASVASRRKHGLGYPLASFTSGPVSRFVRELLLDGAGNGPWDRSGLERAMKRWSRSRHSNQRIARALFLQCWWNECLGS